MYVLISQSAMLKGYYLELLVINILLNIYHVFL